MATDTVKVEPGDYSATGVRIANKTLTVYAFNATLTTPVAQFPNPSLAIVQANVRVLGLTLHDERMPSFETIVGTGPATIVLDRVSIFSTGPALISDQGAVTLTRSSVVARDQTLSSIFISSGTLNIDRSSIQGGLGVRALTQNGLPTDVHVTNSISFGQSGIPFITAQGQAAKTSTSSMTVSFSTIIGNFTCADVTKPGCKGGADDGVCIDNSIILGGPGTSAVSGSACQVSFSLLDPQMVIPTGQNNKVGVDPLFTDLLHNDFHLQAGSPAIDAADPVVHGTPDFDGVMRPQGAASDMGAFELK